MFQQNAQQIYWWAIILPSLITGLFVIIVQILIAYWLSRKTEDYKNDFLLDLKSFENSLSKRLEDYKKDINKDLYQFQTKFSLFHQRQAAAIEEAYSLLVKTEKSLIANRLYLKDITVEEIALEGDKKISLAETFFQSWQSLSMYFDEKRIFFDEEIEEMMDEIIKHLENSYKFSSFSKYVEKGFVKSDTSAKEFWESATEFSENKIPAAKGKLRQKFREILAFEESIKNQQIKKTLEKSKVF